MSMTNQRSSAVGDVGLVHGAQSITLQTLPVELLADIFSELDLDSLVVVSCLSRRLRAVTADASLNPWRHPILRSLQQCVYEKSLFHLSVRSIVPRRNWIEIIAFAPSSFLLFDSTLPNLRSSDWEECFRRRFLPGWTKWKKDNSWRETFMKVLYRVWHRSRSSCTSDESWTKYIVVSRNGSVNELEAASRSFNPLAIFHEMKLQNNLAHLPTQIRVVLQLMDARILALGVVNRPSPHLTTNRNAHAFLYPPGLEPHSTTVTWDDEVSKHYNTIYRRLSYPTPSHTHSNYPMYTPGGGDQRWHPDAIPEEGMQWVGGLMVTVQLHPSEPHELTAHGLQGMELFSNINHAQFATFTWRDFLAIAPWMEERVTECIYGQGLGVH
ncbi:hypothetical protein L210DRAFT_2402058 [Boletus edulis BED1]|uniref:F-box domain-containing protein n=1 Tax=Boletus edulis BED1 TaxID=1328754 RepID=A0AAD4GM37_BOLED|nr:hypothetical protein L210DRAFT_2402058 [Boletus edulis BED1]